VELKSDFLKNIMLSFLKEHVLKKEKKYEIAEQTNAKKPPQNKAQTSYAFVTCSRDLKTKKISKYSGGLKVQNNVSFTT